MNQLANALLAFARAILAVEILADDDVRGQLRPVGRNFAVLLLEQHLAVLIFDGGEANLPIHRLEGIVDVDRTECRLHFEADGIHRRDSDSVSERGGFRAFRLNGRNCRHTAQLLLAWGVISPQDMIVNK